MIAANHPYADAMGAYPMGLPANGWTVGGRFSDFAASEEDNGTFLFSWTIETIADSIYGVFIFKNGEFLTRTREASWVFVPDADHDRWSITFIVLPNHAAYEDASFFGAENLLDRLYLTYTLAGAAETVEIHKNASVGAEIDFTASPVHTYTKAVISIVGTEDAYLAGSWPKQATKFATITVTIDYAGGPGVAQFHWAWGAITSDTYTVQDYFQDINLNGLRLRFDEDATWTVGQSFTISIRQRQDYTSGRLPNGLHRYAVVTANKAGLEAFSDEATYNLSAIPQSPSVEEDYISYVNGSGEVTVFWSMPPDVDIDTVTLYRNHPMDGDGADNVNFPFHSDTITPGQIYSYTVENLQPGINRIWARVSGNGSEEQNLIASKYELTLDASLNAETVPNPPYDFTVTFNSDLTLTVTIITDTSSDLLTVYHDNGTGTVDYNTAYSTVANPQTEDGIELEITGLFLPDGDYLFAVRASSGSVEEENTETKPVTVDTALPAKATGLTIEAVA